MAIGIVDDSDFEDELSKPNSHSISPIPLEGTVVVNPSKGRGKNNNEVPESLRKIIGETANIEGRREALALAKNFGISPSSVSAYTNGSTSTKTYDKPNEELKNHINRSKERISNKAKNRLHWALNNITDEKLKEADLKAISAVAKDMSGIIKDMEPSPEQEAVKNSPQFIVFAPQFNKEDKYETIIVNE